ncbi:MAG: hypothetical protein GX998_09985, partial [Firmicutes bacterium]|nr:hypothetical protein [Bacillota bacterium]
YPFIEGALFDKSFVRAPLLLFPVELVKDKNKWYLCHVEGANPQLNKVFVFAHAKANQSSPPELEWELQTDTRSVDELVSLVLVDLESHGVTISDTSTQEVERFPDYRKDNTPPYLPGTLFLKRHLILGQFPTSNSIYDDYNKLKQRNIDEGPIASLLYTCDSSARNPFDETEEPIKETDYFFISPLDHSQEKALKKIGERNHLVIHGPPGTGKSETIANAIVDNLAKGKRVLMVSQKRAALDVVHSRLTPMHSKMVLIYDGVSDKKKFYQHVTGSLERIVQSPPSQSFSEAKTLSKQIDQELSLLQNSWIALNRVHELGLSLQQLYVKTSDIPRESLTGLLAKLRHNNPFKRLTYDELVSAKENLSQDDNLEAYVQYRSLNEIPSMSYVKQNVDRLGVLSVEQALQDIDVSNYDELKTNPLFTAVLYKLRDMDYPKVAEHGEQMALEFVREQFPELLEPCHDGRWWTLGYWRSYRRMKKEQKRRALLHQQYMDEVQELMESIVAAREMAHFEFGILDEVFSPAGIKLFAEQLLEERNTDKVIGDIRNILQNAEYYSALQ